MIERLLQHTWTKLHMPLRMGIIFLGKKYIYLSQIIILLPMPPIYQLCQYIPQCREKDKSSHTFFNRQTIPINSKKKKKKVYQSYNASNLSPLVVFVALLAKLEG